MNKKGFTLIELLAVIVVLAIIALIATPIVMGVIEKAQEGANERSVEGYMKAWEAAYYVEWLEEGKQPATTDVTTVDYNGADVTNCNVKVEAEEGATTVKVSATGCTVNTKAYNYANGEATPAA